MSNFYALQSNKYLLRARSDKGIFVPLTAAIALVVVTIVFALGYDTTIQKRYAEIARSRMDVICRSAAKELPITGAALSLAANGVSQLVASGALGSATIQSVEFATPLATEAGLLTHNSGPPISLASPFLIPCPAGVTCRLYTSALDPVLTNPITNWLPAGFWTNSDFGDALVCRISLRVNTVLSGTKTVRTAVGWSLRQLGAALSPDPVPPTNFTLRRPSPGLGDSRHKEGGIIIGVDTALSTDSGPNESIPNTPEFRPFSPSALSTWGFANLRPQDTRDNPSPISSINLLGTPEFPTVNQQREERRHACLPLVAAVRNKILVGMIGRLARGWGRDKVAMYTMNPIARNPVALNDGQYLSNVIVPPSQLVAFGQDITAKAYELPYVRFFREGTSVIPKIPDLASSELSVTTSQQGRQMAGMLRDCYHLYTGDGALLNPGLNRISDPRVANFTTVISGGVPQIQQMEGTMMQGTSSPGPLRLETLPALNTPWDQWPDGLNTNPKQSLEQVASILGSVQLCPHQRRGGPNPGGDFACISPKPDIEPSPLMVSRDLRSDIRGFLAAVNEQYVNPLSGSSIGFGAFGGSDIPRAASVPNRMSGTQAASLVLFLHNRILAAEVTQIRAQVNRFEAVAPRKILVIYIPSQPEDLDPTAIANLRDAFNISPAAFPTERDNVLMVIAPTNGLTVSPTELKEYWLKMLKFQIDNASASSYAAFRFLFTEIAKL